MLGLPFGDPDHSKEEAINVHDQAMSCKRLMSSDVRRFALGVKPSHGFAPLLRSKADGRRIFSALPHSHHVDLFAFNKTGC